jgi:hypothetical protein
MARFALMRGAGSLAAEGASATAGAGLSIVAAAGLTSAVLDVAGVSLLLQAQKPKLEKKRKATAMLESGSRRTVILESL